jgi:hypothetical protein
VSGGLRRIGDLPDICTSTEHNPPGHIVLRDGVYEYECPSCGFVRRFVVHNPRYIDVSWLHVVPISPWSGRHATDSGTAP